MTSFSNCDVLFLYCDELFLIVTSYSVCDFYRETKIILKNHVIIVKAHTHTTIKAFNINCLKSRKAKVLAENEILCYNVMILDFSLLNYLITVPISLVIFYIIYMMLSGKKRKNSGCISRGLSVHTIIYSAFVGCSADFGF
jgi:hypothetical protein